MNKIKSKFSLMRNEYSLEKCFGCSCANRLPVLPALISNPIFFSPEK